MVDELIDDMKRFILEICESIGPRPPCSKAEAEGAKYFEENLKKYCDEVIIENFSTHPGAYKAAFRLPVILYIISLCFFWILPAISLIISLISFLILFGEMVLAKEVIDFLFPKKGSQNVIGKIKPTKERKHFLIIGSHIDSNWEFPLIKKFGYGFALIIAINLIFNSLLFLLLIVKNALILLKLDSLIVQFEAIFFWIFIGAIPIGLIQILYIISNRPVMGANDNISGMAICYELAKFLMNPQYKTKSIEIWICAYGCEEIGSKGSKAFVEKHINEIKDANIINIDMVGNQNSQLLIGKSEVIGFVKMDKKLIELIQKSAQSLNIHNKISGVMAYTDSLSFGRKGLSTTSITSLPRSSKDFHYHTRDDTIDNLNFDNLIKTYNILVELIKSLDNQ